MAFSLTGKQRTGLFQAVASVPRELQKHRGSLSPGVLRQKSLTLEAT
jgi:hypothetical protein